LFSVFHSVSQNDAARKLGITGPSVNEALNLKRRTALGHLFRYKLEGDMYKRTAKPVLLLDRDTGESIREYESAVAAGKDLGLSNSSIGSVRLRDRNARKIRQ
jgi:hypothetical protein